MIFFAFPRFNKEQTILKNKIILKNQNIDWVVIQCDSNKPAMLTLANKLKHFNWMRQQPAVIFFIAKILI